MPLLGFYYYSFAILTIIYLILQISSVWKFYYFGIPILPSDVSNMVELFFAVDWLTQFKFILVFIGLAISMGFAIYKAKKPKLKSSLFSICLLIVFMTTLNSTYEYLLGREEYKQAFPERNLKDLGMTTSFLMEYVESKKNIERPSEEEITSIYKDFKTIEKPQRDTPLKRNIYIIIVESMWNIENIFSGGESYFEKNFLKKYEINGSKFAIVNDKFLGTSKTEFEVLCGYPHLGDAVIFKSNINKNNGCLPNVLTELQYETNAYHPYKRFFYNRDYAYPSIGFQNYYSKESFELNDGENFLNDTDFFKQVYKKIKAKNDASSSPQLHYILNVATHYPFSDNKTDREIKPSINNKIIGNYINSVYVATKEINNFIDNVKKEDPESIFVVLGDHAPPIGAAYFNMASKKKREYSLKSYEPLFVPLMTYGFKTQVPKFLSTYRLYKYIMKELKAINRAPGYSIFNVTNENVNYKKEIVFNDVGEVLVNEKPSISKKQMKKIFMDEFYGEQYLKKILKNNYRDSTN